MIRVFGHQMPNSVGFTKLARILLQCKTNFRSTIRLLDIFDGVLAIAIG